MSHTEDKQTREGTDALKEIAEEVVAERESGRTVTVPDDDTPADDAETREDHVEDDPRFVGLTTPADNSRRD
ncbi:hypothetical protein [Demequina flava]|uniref:hypothetical protein n=1 Tax=Demequina flava TaxID=1095025 RepID=UPI000780CB6C|nr:hypothetical protein [Demequina flava]